MHITHKKFRFTAVIERDGDGWFAYCPELKGCHAQGNTYEEVTTNIRDVVQMIVEYMLESGEEVPQSDVVSFTTVDVAV